MNALIRCWRQPHKDRFPLKSLRSIKVSSIEKEARRNIKWHRIAIWFFLLISYTFFGINNGNFASAYELELPGVIFALCGVVLYLLPPLYVLAKREIRLFVDFEETDHETSRVAAYIAAMSAALAVLIVILVAFDYVGHQADANRKEREARQSASTSTEAKRESNQSAAPSVASPVVGQSSPNTMPWLETTGGFLGTFGDFFGGFLNPILTFGTLVALGITILQQRIQVREARREASEAGFERTFFNMLTLHAQNVQDLVFDPAVIPNGNPILLNPVDRVVHLAGVAQAVPRVVSGRAVFAEVLRSTERGATTSESQLDVYRNLQRNHNDVVGHYFRHLYQIIDYVDRFKVDGKPAAFKVRKHFAKILRSQLSSHELAVLLLNCAEGVVDKGAFQVLVKRYQLLEHLPVVANGNQLKAPGIALGSTSVFLQYLDRKSSGEIFGPGAFGANPMIDDYLAREHKVVRTNPV